MKLRKRIYCIEGHWDYGDREVEPSVEPMLQLLHAMGQWEYARRDCATVNELDYFLDREWTRRCRNGSILYIASHGDPGMMWFSDDQSLGLDTLAAKADCTGCLVHFGGCKVLATREERIRDFMADTGAAGVSGYEVETGWADVAGPPALALELLLFSSIWTQGIDLTDGRSASGKLPRLAEKLQCMFPECGFQLHTKWDWDGAE